MSKESVCHIMTLGDVRVTGSYIWIWSLGADIFNILGEPHIAVSYEL
jgi:hypothetical protein